jgi:putative ABC transport system permease protein
LLLLDVRFPKVVQNNPSASEQATEEILKRLRSVPGVSSAAMAYGVPIRYNYKNVPIEVEGKSRDIEWKPSMIVVGHDYFRAMGIPVLSGREFGLEDVANAKRVAVVSKALAERVWPGQNAVGKSISMLSVKRDLMQRATRMPRPDSALLAELQKPGAWERDGAPVEVVGVVGNVRMFGLDVATDPTFYLDYRQTTPGEMFVAGGEKFAVRTTGGEPRELAVTAVSVIHSVENEAQIPETVPMAELVSQSIGGRGSNKLLLIVSVLFGSFSLALAAAGI